MAHSRSDLSFLKILLGLYIFLMCLSWFIQYRYPLSELPNRYENQSNIVVNNKEITIKYLQTGEGTLENSLILLPDSYHGAEYLLPFAHSDTTYSNKIILTYPENDADGNLISHSVKSRSEIIKTFIDSLNIQSPDILGHAYGGLVAIDLMANHTSEQAPFGRLILLSSLGVQELQFLGNQTFNNSLYSLLYPVLFAYKYLIPHMGYYFHQPMDVSYVRTLLQTNQQVVREHLSKITNPVLIIHPNDDNYITPGISEENHRLLPQSFLIIPEGNHRTIFLNPGRFTSHISWFKEAGITRDESEPERVKLSKEKFDAEEIDTINGSALLIIAFLIYLLALISEDLGCISAGLLVASGVIDFQFALLACFLSIMIADIGTYFLGRWLGRPVIEKVPIKWIIDKSDISKAEDAFAMRGVEIIFISRFIPGARFPTYLASGILKINMRFFITYFTLSLLIWVPVMVWLSSVIGQPMIQFIDTYQDYALVIVGLIILIIYLLTKVLIPLFTVRGRRRLVIKIKQMKEKWNL